MGYLLLISSGLMLGWSYVMGDIEGMIFFATLTIIWRIEILEKELKDE